MEQICYENNNYDVKTKHLNENEVKEYKISIRAVKCYTEERFGKACCLLTTSVCFWNEIYPFIFFCAIRFAKMQESSSKS
jgi:hypothetical protein